MGSGMTENTAGCTWLGSVEGGPSERRVRVAAGSTDLPKWKPPPPPWLRTNHLDMSCCPLISSSYLPEVRMRDASSTTSSSDVNMTRS